MTAGPVACMIAISGPFKNYFLLEEESSTTYLPSIVKLTNLSLGPVFPKACLLFMEFVISGFFTYLTVISLIEWNNF